MNKEKLINEICSKTNFRHWQLENKTQEDLLIISLEAEGYVIEKLEDGKKAYYKGGKK